MSWSMRKKSSKQWFSTAVFRRVSKGRELSARCCVGKAERHNDEQWRGISQQCRGIVQFSNGKAQRRCAKAGKSRDLYS